MKSRMASALKWIGFVIIALAVLYAVLLGLSNRRLRQAYAALQADGRPMKAAQIIPAAVPDPDNAVIVYQAVVLQLKAERVGQEDLLTHLGKLSAGILTNTSFAPSLDGFRELSHRKAVMEGMQALETGSAKPGYRYDLDYSKGAWMLLPHLADLRNLTRILCAAAHLQAVDGDHAAAWRTLATSLRMADGGKAEPILVSQLVRMAQFGMTAETLQTICNNTRPTAEQQATIEELLTRFDDNASLIMAMDAERVLFGEWAFNLPYSELLKTSGMVDAGTVGLSPAMMFAPGRHRDHAAYLEIMHAFAKNASQAYSTNDVVRMERMIDAVPRYCSLTRLLVPALSMVKVRHVAMIAEARVTRAGLAVLRYREQQGRYPAVLATTKMEALVDPFSGKPLLYRADPVGFTVYSVGANLVDDNGAKGKTKDSGDIVWRYTEKTEAGQAP